MFDFLFGWRKASKCKKLIRRVQCRLKLLKNKRCVIASHFREDIAQLWKNGFQDIAFNRLDELCKDEDMILVYELLEQFSEFIIHNLAYIRRHKNLPNDVNEAVSTLIFASARCSDLPELKLVRKLFRKRYGQKLIATAVELHPGNFVNSQVQDKLTVQSVSENEKNRLLDEIVGNFPIKPEFLALKYKLDSLVNPRKVTEFYKVKGRDHNCVNEDSSTTISTSCSIVLQSSPKPFIFETLKEERKQKIEEMSSPNHDYGDSEAIQVTKPEISEKVVCSSESSTDHQYSDQDSVIYLDDVQEFKSPIKQDDDRDQRFFMFKSSILYDKDRENIDRERMRRRYESRETQVMNDVQSCYSLKSDKYWKRVEIQENERFYLDHSDQDEDSMDQPFSFYTNDEDYQGEETSREIGSSPDYTSSPSLRKCTALASNARPVTVPEKLFYGADSMTSEKVYEQFNGSNRNMVSPPHVHPKLPDYDEISEKFRALKRIHQQNQFMRSLNMTAPFYIF